MTFRNRYSIGSISMYNLTLSMFADQFGVWNNYRKFLNLGLDRISKNLS
ncbi:hypothetical protein [Tenacibaculum larymnensis]|uniref:Uncharacterized protein n=1 Tax=Tenacibaculum larymnensis TaxID=2878201 RepID=A0A9X4EPU0_9FLAO|nr:hypothetical protein [Tenacibaculum larymnensis]MDE1206010.1 hypothetical protein [Tenacibaculum larymnensis]